MLRTIAVSVLVLCAASRADADPKTEAKPHIEAAMVAHGEGRYADALKELTSAYDIDPQPDLLYAIAQVHVKLDHCADAIPFYEKFLASGPKPGPAKAAREAIAVCKKKVAASGGQPGEGTATPPEPAPAPAMPPPPPPPTISSNGGPPAWYRDVIGDALVGAGVASGIVGIVLYSSARSKLDSAEHATTYGQSQDLVDQAHSRRTLSIVIGAGAVALIGGGLFHYHLHGKHHVEVVASPGAGGAVVGLGGAW